MAHTWTQDCGCKATAYWDSEMIDIEYCPLHRTTPDLLEACKAALPLLGWQGRFEGDSKDALALLEAAIAKAEGKED